MGYPRKSQTVTATPAKPGELSIVLEAAAALPRTRGGGGVVEQAWCYLSVFIPPWIIAAGIGVFVVFHGWEYFNKAQITAVERAIKQAEARLKTRKAGRSTPAPGA